MIGWNFPLNNFGQETGLNDPGIETFKGRPLESLAREINQNSCDAAVLGSGKPVEVHFELHYLPIDKFPGRKEFYEILEACAGYWKDNPKTKTFFDKALETIDSALLPVLKISDYNTTGLIGSDKEHHTDWHNLIKSVGTSDKGAALGGSFGIGKHAPFACSQIRTVFYGTKDRFEKNAFQGVSKLVTHRKKNKDTTQGTGYYGYIDQNRPILDLTSVDEFFRRDQIGTDIFIMGFHETQGWDIKIIKSVIENFFVAIDEERLVVHVGPTAINHSTLPGLLEMYIKNDQECLSSKYYKSLHSPVAHHFTENDFLGLGKIDLYILPEKDFPKRVAMVRGTGMKVFDKGHFQTPLKFAGVFLAKGEKINEFLRNLEPPSHNAWEHERYENPDYARSIVKKIYSWINENVRSIAMLDESEELDFEGMGQYLPDDFEEAPLDSSSEALDGEKGRPKEIEIETILREPIVAEPASGSNSGINNSSGNVSGQGAGRNEGTGAPPPSEATSDAGGGGEASTAAPGSEKPAVVHRYINLKKVRIYCADPDAAVYNVSFETDKEGVGFVYLKIVGEVGEDPAPIKSAFNTTSGEILGIQGDGIIGPFAFKIGVRNSLRVVLGDSLHCALEVSADAN